MTEELRKKITDLLEKSSVSNDHKQRTLRLLPMMTEENLQKVYKALSIEVEELNKISEEEKRLKFKYQMYSDKLSELKNKEK